MSSNSYSHPGHVQGGAHTLGGNSIPWTQVVKDSYGTFKTIDELQRLYEENGVTPNRHVICYCRIGERSFHSRFVLGQDIILLSATMTAHEQNGATW